MSSLDDLKELVLTGALFVFSSFDSRGGWNPLKEVIEKDFLPWGEVNVPPSTHAHPLRVAPSKDPYDPRKQRETLCVASISTSCLGYRTFSISPILFHFISPPPLLSHFISPPPLLSPLCSPPGQILG